MDDIPLSSIGGAAQGGSTKPKEEREQVERQQPGRDDKSPSGSGGQEAPMTPNAPQSGLDEGSDSGGDGD